MKYKWMILGIVGLATCAACIAILLTRNSQEPAEDPGYVNEITLSQVEKHNTAASCWIIADVKVFDVTPNIISQPTDNKFSAYCGKQFPLPTNEPSKELADLYKQLNNYYIGVLTP